MDCRSFTIDELDALRFSYNTMSEEEFQTMCNEENYNIDEVKRELEVDSSSPQPVVNTDNKVGTLHNISIGGFSNVAQYYTNDNMRRAQEFFRQSLTTALLFDFSRNGFDFKNPENVQANISALKLQILNELAVSFGLQTIDPYSKQSEKNADARAILAHVYTHYRSMPSSRLLLDKYVLIKHFDEILKNYAPYILIHPNLEGSQDVFVDKKYSFDAHSTQHFKGFSKSEYASADNMSSVFVKAILNSMPQMVGADQILEGRYTNFKSILACFAELHNWINTTILTSEGDRYSAVKNELAKGIHADLGIISSEYLQSSKHNSVLTNHFKTIIHLLYGKNSSGKYIVPEYYRHCITSAFNKFVKTEYIQYEETLGGEFRLTPLTQRTTMLARNRLINSFIGNAAIYTTNPKLYEEDLNTLENLDALSNEEVVSLTSKILNIETLNLDPQTINDTLVGHMRIILEAFKKRYGSGTLDNNIFKDHLLFSAFSEIALFILPQQSDHIKSVVKNAEGNNLPMNQLPSLSYKIKEMYERAQDKKNCGSGFVYDNISLFRDPYIQSSITINGKVHAVNVLSDVDTQIVAIELNFLNQLLAEEKDLPNVDGNKARYIYIQPDCYSDKSKIFLYPINTESSFIYGNNSETGQIGDLLKRILKSGYTTEDLEIIRQVFFSQYEHQMSRLLDDYDKLFGEGQTTLENYESKVEKYIKEHGLDGFIADLYEKGVTCVEEVHYSKNSINKTFKQLYNIFNNKEEAYAFLKTHIEATTKTLVGQQKSVYDPNSQSFKLVDHWGGAWEHICENELLQRHFKGILFPTRYSSFKKARPYFGEDFIEEEYFDEEDYATDDVPAMSSYIPPKDEKMDYAGNVAAAFFFADMLFGRQINNFLVGDFLAHKGGDITSRYVMQTKRQSVQGATVHNYAQNLHTGVTPTIKIACIADMTAKVFNVRGDENTSLDACDGSGWVSPIFSRCANASLVDAAVGANKKTTFGDINPATGTAVYLKWAEYEMTNELMRLQGSVLNMRQLFAKMHSMKCSKVNGTYSYTPTNLYRFNPTTGNRLEISEVVISSPTFEDASAHVKIVLKNGSYIEENIENINQLYSLLGDAWCQEVSENGDYIWSESNLDLLHTIVCDLGWKEHMISIVANKSAVKVGAANLNPPSAWTDSSALRTFEMSTRFGGAMMNADHILDETDSTEPTQMILALVEKGVSIEESREIYDRISDLIDKSIGEFRRLVGNNDSEEIRKKASQMVIESLERKSKSYGIVGAFIRAYLRDQDKNPLPFGFSEINDIFKSEVFSWITKNVIKRKYGGTAAVLNPAYNVMQYHVVDNKSYLYDELVSSEDFRKRVRPYMGGMTDGGYDAIFNEVFVTNYTTNSIERNPFLVKQTPDVEDTIVIFNRKIEGKYLDQYNKVVDTPYEVVKIDSFEKYIKYRKRTDLDFYVWTIRPHNLKGVDIQYTYADAQNKTLTVSAYETKLNIALYLYKTYAGKDLEQELNRIYGIDFIADEKVRTELKNHIGSIIKRIDEQSKDVYNEVAISRLEALHKRELTSPRKAVEIDGVLYNLIHTETIPAQIIMGKAYASEFGLTANDTINSIRNNPDFFKKKVFNKYRDIKSSEIWDFVLYDQKGNRILIKYHDSGHPLSEEFGELSDSEALQVVDNAVIYQGYTLLDLEGREAKCRQIQDASGNIEDIIIIDDLTILDDLKQSDFSLLFFNFTEENYDITFNTKYKFDDDHDAYSLWNRDGSRSSIQIIKEHSKLTGTQLIDMIDYLNNNEYANFNHKLSNLAELQREAFENSLNFIGTRIPCQSMQSFMACRIVAFSTSTLNKVYVPNQLSWIQGSDYDIDKLFLMGYTPDTAGRIQFTTRKRSSYAQVSNSLKNQIMKTIWDVVTNPQNVFAGAVEVNVNTLKRIAATMSKNAEALTPFNALSKFVLQNENAVGKACIGITATGNKGFSVTTLFANEMLQFAARNYNRGIAILDRIKGGESNPEHLKVAANNYFERALEYLRIIRTKDGKALANLNYDVFNNYTSTDSETEQFYECYNIIEKLKHAEYGYIDVAQSIGELLNAAADNAKELLLKKVHADITFMDMYIVGLMMGKSLSDISEIISSAEKLDTAVEQTLIKISGNSKKMISKSASRKEEFETLINAAEELSILGQLTKINQGLPSSNAYDQYKFITQINHKVNKLLNLDPRKNEAFNIFEFVLNPNPSEWIDLAEEKKIFINPLAIIFNHSMFMSMWKAYAIGNAFVQEVSVYDRALQAINEVSYDVIGNSLRMLPKDEYVSKLQALNARLITQWIENQEIIYEIPEGHKLPNSSTGVESGEFIKAEPITFSELITNFIIPKLKSEYVNNQFLNNLTCTVQKCALNPEKTMVVWIPNINMTEISEDISVERQYKDMVEGWKILQNMTVGETTGIKMYRKVNGENKDMTISDLFYIYNLINNKLNSRSSYLQFYEDSLVLYDSSELGNSFIKTHAEWIDHLELPTLIEYTHRTASTRGTLLSRIGEYIKSTKKSQYSILTNEMLLENIPKSKHIVMYHNGNMEETLNSFEMPEDIVQQFIKYRPKGFIWNGTVFINYSYASESDLVHELIHIVVGNMKLNQEGRTRLRSVIEQLSNTKEWNAIQEKLGAIAMYENLSDEDFGEEVLCHYFSKNYKVFDEFAPDIMTEVEHLISNLSIESDAHLEEMAKTKILRFKKLQKVQAARNQLIEDGRIDKECQ